ncbi:hypothetical protein GOBAR_AA22616 [Gossypium barbadense]|uniref:Uncharacterized protein n=1 Tax=Gossypium barbadense TaxID=3634 RepID=A0A2P5X405_GOSBA|nr:hypothetical protein GOBAR_AA22616 [Gossypium barbadense]
MKKFLSRYSVFSHMVQSRQFIPNSALLRVFPIHTARHTRVPHFVWEMKQSPFKLVIQLQIEELDEWRTQKLRTLDKSKSSQDELNVTPNQLKFGDKVLLDVANPRIAASEPNEEIPLTVLSIFPYGTVEAIHPKFSTFKVNNTHLKPYVDKVDSRDEECKLLAPP